MGFSLQSHEDRNEAHEQHKRQRLNLLTAESVMVFAGAGADADASELIPDQMRPDACLTAACAFCMNNETHQNTIRRWTDMCLITVHLYHLYLSIYK